MWTQRELGFHLLSSRLGERGVHLVTINNKKLKTLSEHDLILVQYEVLNVQIPMFVKTIQFSFDQTVLL